MSTHFSIKHLLLGVAAALAFSAGAPAKAKDVELLNVSYDPTRELYEDYNKVFAAYWLTKTGDKLTEYETQRCKPIFADGSQREGKVVVLDG